MNDTDLRAHLARALGRPLASVAELRLALIIGGMLAAAGEPAEQALVIGCDVYARLQDRGLQRAAPTPAPRPPGR